MAEEVARACDTACDYLEEAAELLVRPTPESLDRCASLLSDVSQTLRALIESLEAAPPDEDTREAIQRVRQEALRVGGLTRALGALLSGWVQGSALPDPTYGPTGPCLPHGPGSLSLDA